MSTLKRKFAGILATVAGFLLLGGPMGTLVDGSQSYMKYYYASGSIYSVNNNSTANPPQIEVVVKTPSSTSTGNKAIYHFLRFNSESSNWNPANYNDMISSFESMIGKTMAFTVYCDTSVGTATSSLSWASFEFHSYKMDRPTVAGKCSMQYYSLK